MPNPMTLEVNTPDGPAEFFVRKGSDTSPARGTPFDRDAMIREALDIAERTGAGIVPLVNKAARLKDWQNNPKRSPQAIRGSLSNPWVNGAGVLLPDGFCIVDTDTADAEEWARQNLPPTFTVKTRKGYHRYYSTPGPIRQDRSGIHPGVDILSRRNYAVYVGSVHPDTGRVEYHHTDSSAPIGALPEWLYRKLKPRTPATHRGIPKTGDGQFTITPLTLERMNDTSNGRDTRVYQVVCSLLQSGAKDVEDVITVLSPYPLWGKVEEQENPDAYINHKVGSALRFIAENPAGMTVEGWRSAVAGSGEMMKVGLNKALEAIGLMAQEQSIDQGREITRLTISSRTLSERSSMTRRSASDQLKRAVEAGWLKLDNRGGYRQSAHANEYLLTIPASAAVTSAPAACAVINPGHDAFNKGGLMTEYKTLNAIASESGKTKDLAERTGQDERAVRRHTGKLREAELVNKQGLIWNAAPDLPGRLDRYAEENGLSGKAENRRIQHREQQALYADYSASRARGNRKMDLLAEKRRQAGTFTERPTLDMSRASVRREEMPIPRRTR